jgi:hypothetical protein
MLIISFIKPSDGFKNITFPFNGFDTSSKFLMLSSYTFRIGRLFCICLHRDAKHVFYVFPE